MAYIKRQSHRSSEAGRLFSSHRGDQTGESVVTEAQTGRCKHDRLRANVVRTGR